MKPKWVDWAGATRKQRIERWENVLRVLRSLTPHQRQKHWDMNHWGDVTECGTVACAAGHCAMDPWFIRRGFASNMAYWGSNMAYWGWNGWQHFYPRDFFGKTGADRIFFDTTARSVGTVIREVRDYIKQLKAELQTEES